MIENYIGIDAGGTKAIAVLTDAKLRILARERFEGMNVSQMNPNTVSRLLQQIIDDLTYRAGMLPYHIGLTILAAAGAGEAKTREEVEYACHGRMPERKVKVITDAEAALAGAFVGGAGIVLISGTGSIAWGKDDRGRIVRAGGYGYLLGDEGSGFWLGREALRRCLAAHHRGETTALAGKICEIWQLSDIAKAVTIVYSAEKPAGKIAELAPLVFESYEAGDPLSVEILQEAGKKLAELVETTVKGLSLASPIKVNLTGGIASQVKVMQPLIQEHLPGEYQFVPAAYDAAVGAVIALMTSNKQEVTNS